MYTMMQYGVIRGRFTEHYTTVFWYSSVKIPNLTDVFYWCMNQYTCYITVLIEKTATETGFTCIRSSILKCHIIFKSYSYNYVLCRYLYINKYVKLLRAIKSI